MKVLITSTSFTTSIGRHHEMLNRPDIEVVFKGGPLNDDQLKEIHLDFDGIICGDDDWNKSNLLRAKAGGLKVLSKYGIGLDKVDVEFARSNGILVTNTPGVNSDAVAEHVLALILCYERNLFDVYKNTKSGIWQRPIGAEIFSKTIGIVGFGSIGKKVALKFKALGLKVLVYDPFVEERNFKEYKFVSELYELAEECDYVSLNVVLNRSTTGLIDRNFFDKCKKTPILINTARAGIVNEQDLIYALNGGVLRAYLTDVLDKEPMEIEDKLWRQENVWISSHIGSRNSETIERQGMAAVQNLLSSL